MLRRTLFILFLLSASGLAHAYCPRNAPSHVRNRFEKQYDMDKDGCLDFRERGRYRTHQILGWELADTKKKRKYDLDKDLMLNEKELEAFHESKRTYRTYKNLEKEKRFR